MDNLKLRLQKKFNIFVQSQGLHASRQRDSILDKFLQTKGHITSDELLKLVHKSDAKIGAATVYRTLKLLVESGLANIHNFGDGKALYEVQSTDHHDHLICTQCHAITEFHNPQIEFLQDEVAQEFGFCLTHHKMQLFGVCTKCQK